MFEFSTTKVVNPTYFGFLPQKKSFYLQASVITTVKLFDKLNISICKDE